MPPLLYTIRSAIVVAIIALSAGFAANGAWIAVACVLVGGSAWMIGALRQHASAPTLSLLACFVAAVYGTFEQVSLPLLLVALAAALVAWDLGQLQQRLRPTSETAFADLHAQAHQRRTLAVSAIGLLCALFAVLVHVPLSFGWALLLGIIATIGLVRTARLFQRESE